MNKGIKTFNGFLKIKSKNQNSFSKQKIYQFLVSLKTLNIINIVQIQNIKFYKRTKKNPLEVFSLQKI